MYGSSTKEELTQMYSFQFQDGSYRIDIMTSSKEQYPRYGTEAQKLFHAAYATQREANQAIERIRQQVL
jgi:hypothetical protein